MPPLTRTRTALGLRGVVGLAMKAANFSGRSAKHIVGPGNLLAVSKVAIPVQQIGCAHKVPHRNAETVALTRRQIAGALNQRKAELLGL